MLLLVLGAIAVIVAVRWVADRTGLPAAALLTLVGIAYALLPGPNVTLDPDLILTLVLPPLLYSAALDSSLPGDPPQPAHGGQPLGAAGPGDRPGDRRRLRAVRRRARPWPPGIALGAAVAPPDPVAALAVGRKAGLPPRLITMIQGEGLLNDATALTILSWRSPRPRATASPRRPRVGQFLLAAAGGVAAGVAVAYGVRPLRRLRRRPAVVQRDLPRDAVRRLPARPSRCTSPACSPSSSPG